MGKQMERDVHLNVQRSNLLHALSGSELGEFKTMQALMKIERISHNGKRWFETLTGQSPDGSEGCAQMLTLATCNAPTTRPVIGTANKEELLGRRCDGGP